MPRRRGREGELKRMGLLPKCERRKVDSIDKKVFWIYGAPYCGKTYFANTFPNPLMINTDGNYKFVDAPYVHIKDEKEGRVDKMAWENFKAVVDELAVGGNGFETIIVDITEDLKQYCRQYIFKREGYVHESDGGYGKGWSLVDNEFYPVIQKLKNMDYKYIIFISHEGDETVTMRTGEKITKYVPKDLKRERDILAGMMDFTGRFVAEGDTRTINIKNSEFQFGGGRAEFRNKVIPATFEGVEKLYEISPKSKTETKVGE